MNTPATLRAEIARIDAAVIALEKERDCCEAKLCEFFAKHKVGDDVRDKQGRVFRITRVRLGITGTTDVYYNGVRLRKDGATPVASVRPRWLHWLDK